MKEPSQVRSPKPNGAKIHHNTLTNTAATLPASWIMAVQLLVASSDGSIGGTGGIEIYENTIDGTAYPLGVITHSGRPTTKQVYVHHNVMTLRASTTRVGAADGSGTGELFSAAANNRFNYNTYRVPDRRVLGVERPDLDVEPVAGTRA